MLGALFHRAQLTFDYALVQLLQRVAVGAIFLVAAIFAINSLSYYLDRQLGPELGNLAMAGLFAALGMIGLAFVATRPSASASAEQEIEAEKARDPASGAWFPSLRPEDRDLAIAAFQAMAPIFGPRLARTLVRNAPLLIVAAVVAYVMATRMGSSGEGAAASGQESGA